MSEVAAPGPSAPAAPASPPASAPSPTTAADRGPPPRGHKWAEPAKTQAPPAGRVPIPSTPTVAAPPAAARTPQEVSTGQRAPEKPKAGLPVGKQPETATQRQARMEKFRQADGTEVEVDVAEFLERYRSTEKTKVKVNGKEREYTLAEALERLPLGEGAHERFREAHTVEEKAKAQIARAKQELSPLAKPETALAVLEKIHGRETVTRMMEQALAAQYERERLPEDQRRALEMREQGEAALSAERRKFEREREAFQAQQRAEQQQRYETAVKTETARIHRDFPILLREAGMPVTPKTMARLAQAAAEAKALKIPYTEKQLAAQVAQEYREEMGHLAEASDPETLRATLGKGADKLRQAEVDRVMKQPGRGRPVIAKPGKIPDSIKTPDQLRKHLREQDAAAERRLNGSR